HDVVLRGDARGRIRVAQRSRVNIRQRELRRARLVAGRVGRRASVVVAIDVVDADRQVRDGLVLDARVELKRTRELRVRIDRVAHWSEHAIHQSGGRDGRRAAQLVALYLTVEVGVQPA